MKDKVTVNQNVEETIHICDECGREADRHLIPKEAVEKRLGETEGGLKSALEAVDVPDDVPEPVYEEHHRVESAGSSQPIMGATTMTVTATLPFRPGSQRSSSKDVTERHYDGIDTDERELIERAEALEETRAELQAALVDALTAIQRLSHEHVLTETVDLCDDCYSDRFGWDDDDE